MPNPKILEPHPKLIPIRHSYFKKDFWTGWEQLEDSQKEIYILGWLAKLDHALTRMERRINKLKHAAGEPNHEASDRGHNG
jgi:hypothetical protein